MDKSVAVSDLSVRHSLVYVPGCISMRAVHILVRTADRLMAADARV